MERRTAVPTSCFSTFPFLRKKKFMKAIAGSRTSTRSPPLLVVLFRLYRCGTFFAIIFYHNVFFACGCGVDIWTWCLESVDGRLVSTISCIVLLSILPFSHPLISPCDIPFGSSSLHRKSFQDLHAHNFLVNPFAISHTVVFASSHLINNKQ